MRAGTRILVVTGGMALVVAVILGMEAGLGIPLPIFLAVVLGGVLLFRSRTVRTVEIGWSGGGAIATPIADIPLQPAARPRTGRGSVSRSVSRVEARELFSSPWFAAGIGFWLVLFATMGFMFVDDVERSWWEVFGLATMMCHPFAGMAIVAAHRNRSRSRRDGCDEMFDACPADADARTLGHLLTAWIGALACAIGLSVFVLLVALRNPRIYGPFDAEAVAALLACAAIGAGAVALGVTVARWLPWALVPFAAVVGVGLLSGQVNRIGDPGWAPDRFLATFVASPGLDALFYTRPVWARIVWLVALAAIVGALGLVGSRRIRSGEVAVGIAAVLAVVAGLFVAMPAGDGEVEKIAARILDPIAHATCRSAAPEVRVCAYGEYAELADRTAEAVAPVAAAIPVGAIDDVVFLTHLDHDVKRLQADVRSALKGRQPRLPENALRIRFFSTPANFDAARFRLAAFAVGLPTEADADYIGTVVAGQARGVVALWLATRGLEAGRAAALVDEVEGPGGEPFDATDRGAVWPGGCHNEAGVLLWAPKDLAAAQALLKLDGAVVQRLVAENWSRFTAPATTTDDLLVAAGLAPLGAPERIEARDVSC